MTSAATGVGVFCAVGLNVAAAILPQTPPPPNPRPPLQTSAKSTQAEITVTGCLIQGSSATVFVLQNAKRDPQSAAEKAARYVVVPATEDLFLRQHLNHQVRILGVPDGRPQPTPPAGSPVDEKQIPARNAKSLTMVSPSCGGGGGGGGEGATSDAGPVGLVASTSWALGGGSRLPDFAKAVEPVTPNSSNLFGSDPKPTVEFLGEDVPASGPASVPAEDVPFLNPKPGTLLLIASGLLLVVYAGRQHDWHAFGRRRLWTAFGRRSAR